MILRSVSLSLSYSLTRDDDDDVLSLSSLSSSRKLFARVFTKYNCGGTLSGILTKVSPTYDAIKREDYQTLSRAQSFVKGTRIILFTPQNNSTI